MRTQSDNEWAAPHEDAVDGAVKGWLAKGPMSKSLTDGSAPAGQRKNGTADGPDVAGAKPAHPPRWTINGGARVDYVLQESEFEAANEYLAAMKAHNSYFGSADVAAFVVHEVVSGVHADE